MRESHGVIIREVYKDYTPPVRARQTVDGLLNGIPKRHLAGLNTVVVTHSANLPRRERREKTKARGKKVPIVRCGGLYHGKWHGEPAWIQLLLDNIFESWPKWMLRIPFLQDMILSDTLFHELGHHIHSTQAPQHKEREDVAEDWNTKLSRHYFRKHYWYLTPLFLALRLVLKPIYWRMKRQKKANK
ncbi:MAG: hypothetical protein JXQ75_04110 [Phycisphaerae bacterium]|nr:hypothetical protein [Phycisphaerae bacterium]